MAEKSDKISVNATAVPVEHEAIAEVEAGSKKPDRNLAAAVWAIVCGVALPCIPVLVVSAVLLYFIFHYRIVPATGWADLHIDVAHNHPHKGALSAYHDLKHQGGRYAYFVHYNPSTITTIASWTGRVIPYLTSSIMGLVAFFAARMIVQKSKRGDGSDLPSPEQLTLLIGLLGGSGFGPLRDTIWHSWAKKERLIHLIPFAFYALFLVTFVGYVILPGSSIPAPANQSSILIPIADTWFGIATTADTITQLYNTTTSDYQKFSRVLSSTVCPNGPGAFSGFGLLEWLGCNIDYENGDAYALPAFLANGYEANVLLQGLSTTNAVLNHTMNGTNYMYLANQNLDAKLDFKAKTLAVSTQCAPITSKCVLPTSEWPYIASVSIDSNNTGDYYNFECTPGFTANFTFNGAAQTMDALQSEGGMDQTYGVPLVGLAFAPSASLASRVGTYVPNLSMTVAEDLENLTGTISPDSPYLGSNWSYQYILPQNPLHFAVWASGFPAVDGRLVTSGLDPTPLLKDHEVYTDGSSAYWMLGCGAVVHDVEYTWVNGSIHTFNATPASAAMGGLISGPFAFQFGQAAVALTEAASAAGVQNNSEELASVFAESWSHAAVALSIGAFEASPNVIEQYRNSTIPVARVPMVPLYLLLGLKAIYVLAVIILAIGAYCFTHPSETEMVKAQLSTKGLAAAHFDTPGLVQQNVVKEIQNRLTPKAKTTDDLPPSTEEEERRDQAEVHGEKVKRAATEPLSTALPADRRVGLVAGADGAWKFALVADGVWKSIKPIAVNLLDLEAKDGNLGVAGDVINAWN
ncbi:hypothetical protein LTR85_003244 [Meristemomyces frigidus]|nr:hypothetical protein LTR85_003244 [Meristemomyces frigidus]